MNWVGGVSTPEAAQQIFAQGGIPNIARTQCGKIHVIEIE